MTPMKMLNDDDHLFIPSFLLASHVSEEGEVSRNLSLVVRRDSDSQQQNVQRTSSPAFKTSKL